MPGTVEADVIQPGTERVETITGLRAVGVSGAAAEEAFPSLACTAYNASATAS